MIGSSIAGEALLDLLGAVPKISRLSLEGLCMDVCGCSRVPVWSCGYVSVDDFYCIVTRRILLSVFVVHPEMTYHRY